MGDLAIRYAIDGDTSMVNVTTAMLPHMGLAREELLKLGVQNLHRLYPNAHIERSEKFGMITQSGDLESSWMLDFTFWAEEAKRFKGTLVASVPSRDVMVWADGADAELVEDMRRKSLKIQSERIGSNRALSCLLYAWRKGAWEMYER